MKILTSLLVTLLCLVSISVSAQNSVQTESKISTIKPLSFTYIGNISHTINLDLPSQSLKKDHFLTGTGFLLQGLKFSSAVDEFNATAPFDIRGYEPNYFSSFSQIIKKNYLLQNNIQPIQ